MGNTLADVFEKRLEALLQRGDDKKKAALAPAKGRARLGAQCAAARVRSRAHSARDMSFDEKRQLCVLINSLEPKYLGKIVQIIHRSA
jgi:hypothetical protein